MERTQFMSDNGLNILSIGYTRELFDKGSDLDDTIRRLTYYSQKINNYFVIVNSYRHHHFRQKQIGENFWVYPTNGYNRPHSLLKMILIGCMICRKNRISLIQVQDSLFTGSVGYALSKIFCIPLNVIVYGTNPYDKNWISNSKLNQYAKKLACFILHNAQGIQVDALGIAKSLTINGIKKQVINIKPIIPIKIKQFEKTCGKGIREKLLGDYYSHCILFVGRLESQKNLFFYLEVIKNIVKKYPKSLFVFIGDGKLRIALEDRCKRMQIEKNTLWLGKISYKNIPEYYSACDLFVLPSSYEGFSRVLMEAAIAGKPIVTSNVSGADDAVLDGESGFILPINDLSAFVKYISKLIEDSNLSERMGIKGREFMRKQIERHSNLDKQIDIWNVLVKGFFNEPHSF